MHHESQVKLLWRQFGAYLESASLECVESVGSVWHERCWGTNRLANKLRGFLDPQEGGQLQRKSEPTLIYSCLFICSSFTG